MRIDLSPRWHFALDRSDQCHTHADSPPGYCLQCIRHQPGVCLVIALLEKGAHEFSATSSYFRSYTKAPPTMFAVSPFTVNTPPASPRPVRLRVDCALA